MYWKDEGFLLSKNNLDENSIIIDVFTQKHGKYTGIIYGGSSRKQKKNFQIGNKILVHWKSKGQNRNGYFSSELIKPISPLYFDDKKKIACILSSTSILKILLPDSQRNEIIYKKFETMIEALSQEDWIKK
jgi:DNA repair protein RecO (recombination protein O)